MKQLPQTENPLVLRTDFSSKVVLNMADVASGSTTVTPILLADLPAGRGHASPELDKLQWSPGIIP